MSDSTETSNIVALPGCKVPKDPDAPLEPNEALVSILEQVLEKARSGELRNFVGTGFLTSGDRIMARSDPEPDAYTMLGAITWLQREYMDFIDAHHGSDEWPPSG